ncbi:MAG: uroporphyrinogen decarboxylase family protein [Coriobacteriales bacterium]|jgi:hypothetical protein
MLTAKENMRECIKGGNPDRFVNQYEAMQLVINPSFMASPSPKRGELDVKNAWGVYNSWPSHVPGPFPDHAPDKILIKDIEEWQSYVTPPSLDLPDELWNVCQDMMDKVDGNLSYKAVFVAPGLFEQTHHFCSMTEALVNYMEYPDEMHDLIKMLTDWEMELAEKICDRLHPDMLFHHDDWGTERNSFMDPDLWADFFVEPYKQIYGYYHDHGVEFVVHHSDSYCANLVDGMIEMGIDVWQGCMRTNKVDELLKKYKGKITFMGNIDNKQVDFDGWTTEDCKKAADLALDGFPTTGYIPCITQGGPGSVYPGTYAELTKYIDEWNCEKFGCTQADIEANRMPLQIMF